jgi:zona occludens toxin (predicted ATPase)
MALPILAPAITKTRQAISQTSQRALLRLVPEFEGARRTSGRSFAIFGTLLMLAMMLAMFVISSFSTKDAFLLAKLQREAQVLSDQRDAINREVSFRSSPNVLAAEAIKLGMQPNSQPRFIAITDEING